MRHALAVRLVQRIGNLDGVLQYLLQRQRAFHESLREGLAFQIFHHEEIDSVLLANVEESADVRMIQAGDDASFALESLTQFSSVSEMTRKNLNGDNSAEASITGLVNFAHSARTDRGEDF